MNKLPPESDGGGTCEIRNSPRHLKGGGKTRDGREGDGTPRETGKKILAPFVWQQRATEPQGHANERKAFQRAAEWEGLELQSGLLTDTRTQRGVGGVGGSGRGSLRGQGSEPSRDPTTTNAGLIFRALSPSGR